MDRKIKVVRIINRFNIGGPVFNATLLTKYLGDEFETTLIGGIPDKDEKDSLHILEEYGVKPIILESVQRSINPFIDLKAYREIKKIIEEIKPDIVHTHASKAGFLGRTAALKLKVPVIVHTFHGHVFHSYFGKPKTELFKQIERSLAKRTSGVIAISDIQKHELSEVFNIAPKEKIEVIPLGFDLTKFHTDQEQKRRIIREHYEISEEEIAITIIGRLAPIKDHDYFLQVIENVLEQTQKKIKVFIVGDGEEHDHVKEQVNKINAKHPGVIKMTSWILDISTFIQGMDILCLTSKNEGTPVSIIEALASGTPVITTDVGGVKDLLEDGKSWYVIKREDIETYIEKLRLLVEDSELRKKFAIFGMQNILEKYSYQRLVKDVSEYYKKLLKQ